MLKKIDNLIMTKAAEIFADTNNGLSGRQITKLFSDYAFEHSLHLPYISYPFPSDLGNKRTAFEKNLQACPTEIQLRIILNLCEDDKFRTSDIAKKIKDRLLNEYPSSKSILSDNTSIQGEPITENLKDKNDSLELPLNDFVVKYAKTVFISYSWKNETEVNIIDTEISSNKIKIIRDKRDTQYKDSFKDFMKRIRETDYVLMIISDDYLKSSNCMYEVLEFIKDCNFRERLLPIILDNATNIFDKKNWTHYLDYWKNEELHYSKSISDNNPINVIPLIEEKKKIENIKLTIMDFLEVIVDMKTINYEDLKQTNFQNIKQFVNQQ